MSDEIIHWGGAVVWAAVGYWLAGSGGAVLLSFVWLALSEAK